jgi:aldose 1-epimerase
MRGETIRLDDGHARLTIAAEGGAILRYDALPARRAPLALMKPAEGDQAFGCQVLVPFSNRISGGGFTFDGRFHAIEPNVPGEAFPIHGDGFQKPWRVVRTSPTVAELALDHGSIGPYRYAARLKYALDEGALAATIEAENRAAIRLPFGLGFHPWFPRHPGTTLHAQAARVWLEDERHLPTGVAPIASRPQWDFSRPSPLPQAWVNNGFDGWDRRAEIAQPEDEVALSIEASPELGVYILYSPSSDAGFFCFEPVSHVVDAHHGEGLTVLEPGAMMQAQMRISWWPLI